MNSVMLSSFYETGNQVGHILAWVFGILLAIEVIYVMVKYLFSKEKNS